MKAWKIGAIVAGIVWLVLKVVYIISGKFRSCDFGEEVGAMCTSHVQDVLLNVFDVLALPFMFLRASPNVSSVGPIGVFVFWAGGFVVAVLLGMLIGWIVRKVRRD